MTTITALIAQINYNLPENLVSLMPSATIYSFDSGRLLLDSIWQASAPSVYDVLTLVSSTRR